MLFLIIFFCITIATPGVSDKKRKVCESESLGADVQEVEELQVPSLATQVICEDGKVNKFTHNVRLLNIFHYLSDIREA